MLRKNMTEQERKLWNILRNNQFYELKFKRQVPIGNYVADFVYYDIFKGQKIVEDVKSEATKTQVYKLKKKLFEYRYPELEIKEV